MSRLTLGRPRLSTTTGLTALTILATAGQACGAGAVRPRFAPFPQALTDTIQSETAAIINALHQVLSDEGLQLRWVRPTEGYVETRWFNLRTGMTVGGADRDLSSTVRLRFWVDPLFRGGSLLVTEVARRRIIDPSLPERETEEPVPADHLGDALARRVLDALRSRLSDTEGALP